MKVLISSDGQEIAGACYLCGATQNSNGYDNLRPYGPGGSIVCFDCIIGDPKRERAAKKQFAKHIEENSASVEETLKGLFGDKAGKQ